MRTFDSGSVRDSDEGKPMVNSIPAYVRLRYGEHMSKNAQKYAKNNWVLGQPDDVILDSLHRHLAQWENDERSEDHLSALFFAVIMLMQNENRNEK